LFGCDRHSLYCALKGGRPLVKRLIFLFLYYEIPGGINPDLEDTPGSKIHQSFQINIQMPLLSILNIIKLGVKIKKIFNVYKIYMYIYINLVIFIYSNFFILLFKSTPHFYNNHEN
jgi:hypothetical protein